MCRGVEIHVEKRNFLRLVMISPSQLLNWFLSLLFTPKIKTGEWMRVMEEGLKISILWCNIPRQRMRCYLGYLGEWFLW